MGPPSDSRPRVLLFYPEFVVFHDRSLSEVAQMRPKSKQDFAAIGGVGGAKLRDLASPFMELITGHSD